MGRSVLSQEAMLLKNSMASHLQAAKYRLSDLIRTFIRNDNKGKNIRLRGNRHKP
jgi:hypothetical protein